MRIGDPAVRVEVALRPFAFPPALVVEGERYVAFRNEGRRIVGQIQVFHPRVAVTQQNRGARLAVAQVVRAVEIPPQHAALGIECNRLLAHRRPSLLLVD